MTWWASGNARQPEGPQAREAGRLDRRLLGTTRAGTGPAPSQNIIRAQIIIISGTGAVTGLFEYSGAPALGNPPIAYVAAPGVTHDPFSNVLPATSGGFVTTSGTSWAQLLGVALTFGSPGNTVNPNVGGAGDGLNVASGATAALSQQAILTLTPAAASTNPLAVLGALLRITSFTAASELLGLLQTGDTVDRLAINSNGQLSWSTGTLAADTTLARTAAGQLTIGSNLVVATVLVNALDLANQSVAPTPPAGSSVVYSDINGYPAAKVAVSGDTNAYQVTHLFKQVAPRSQSFSAIAAANIAGLSAAVGIGKYVVRARLIIQWNALAGIPQMQFAGPAINQYDVSFKSQQSGTTSTANDANTTASGTVSGSGYNSGLIGVTGAMTAAGISFDMDIWGMFDFSASGTLTLQAASSVAGDAYLVISGFWEVSPIG